MKTAAIILLIVIVYAVIGYVFSTCIKAWDTEHTIDDEDYAPIGGMWIFILPFLLLYAVVRFIGKRLAVIPVMIIALIKAREGEEEDDEG